MSDLTRISLPSGYTSLNLYVMISIQGYLFIYCIASFYLVLHPPFFYFHPFLFLVY